MNKFQLKGWTVYYTGVAQESFGRLVGNLRQQAIGFEKQSEGKAKIAIGNAQKAIKVCLDRHAPPDSIEEQKMRDRNQLPQ